MTEIKQTWLTCYGLSDHDFPIKWMFRLRRSEGFSGWFPISPSSALRALSPSREKVLFRFLETVDSATPGKPFVQNDMRVGWEWKKKQFIWVCRHKRHDKNRSTQNSTHESIKTHCWWYQSIISALSININAEIRQEPMHRASTCKAFSVYKQSAQYQRPMHTASTTLNATLTKMRSSSTSMLRVSTANADITRLPYARFL